MRPLQPGAGVTHARARATDAHGLTLGAALLKALGLALPTVWLFALICYSAWMEGWI